MVCSDNARCNQPFRPYPEEYGSRILLLPFIPSDWTLHAFGMSGLLTSLLMQRYANREHPGKFIGMLCILGAGMLILALVSHPTGLSPRYRLPRPGCFIVLPPSSRYSAFSIG